jgi:hypothetical protein
VFSCTDLNLSVAALPAAVAAGTAQCAPFKSTSGVFGSGTCGTWFDDTAGEAAKQQHLQEVQVWYDQGCLMGLKTVLAGSTAAAAAAGAAAAPAGGRRESMHGVAMGSSWTLLLEPDEVINSVDIKVGR